MRLIFCKADRPNSLMKAIMTDLNISVTPLSNKDHVHQLKGHETDVAVQVKTRSFNTTIKESSTK
jgi:uncharacterized protein YggU (UPF0235/DUF167 family)